jgi:hypothetical protein
MMVMMTVVTVVTVVTVMMMRFIIKRIPGCGRT